MLEFLGPFVRKLFKLINIVYVLNDLIIWDSNYSKQQSETYAMHNFRLFMIHYQYQYYANLLQAC